MKPSLLMLACSVSLGFACLPGCGSKPAPELEPAISLPENAATAGDNLIVAPAEAIPAVSPPSDDRYANPQNAATNTVALLPWKGPRPELPVSPLTLVQFNATWQIDLDIADQPLAKVIDQITAAVPNWQPQLLVATDRQNAAAAVTLSGVLEKPITLKLAKVSRLEAIERACEMAGVYPEYAHEHEFAAGSKPIIRLHAGPRSRKFGVAESNPPARLVAFVGPQMIEIVQLQEFPPYAVGNLELRMLSLPLPAAVKNLLAGPAWQFDRVLLSGGRDIHSGHGGTTRVIVPTVLQAYYDSLQLKDLLRNVTQIAEVQGKVSLPLAQATSVIWLDSLVEGYSAQNEALTATVKTNSVSPGSWYLRYEVVSGNGLAGLVAFAYDAAGNLIVTDGYGTSWAPGFNQGSGSLNLSTEPRMLAVVVIDQISSFESDFSLTNVPLSKSAEQPVELPKLTFGKSEQTLIVNVGELKRDNIFKEVQLTLTNPANKDIREISVTLHYLDVEGNKLLDSPTVIAAKYDDPQAPYPILLKSESTVKLMQTAFLCPDATKQVKVTVNSILYADLDRWPAEE